MLGAERGERRCREYGGSQRKEEPKTQARGKVVSSEFSVGKEKDNTSSGTRVFRARRFLEDASSSGVLRAAASELLEGRTKLTWHCRIIFD